MSTSTDTISLESIQRQLPYSLREAPVDKRIAYIRRKKRQFKLLFVLGLGMAAILIILTAVTFFLPDIDPEDNLVMSMIIVALFVGASFGNRKMSQRYEDFEQRMEMEREKE